MVAACSDGQQALFLGPTDASWHLGARRRVGGPRGGLWQRRDERERERLGFASSFFEIWTPRTPIYSNFCTMTKATQSPTRFTPIRNPTHEILIDFRKRGDFSGRCKLASGKIRSGQVKHPGLIGLTGGQVGWWKGGLAAGFWAVV
jgi:hypothetical protein